MKTLVVLSALAALAIAAPALPEEKSEDLQKTITKLPENLTREKKSPQESTDVSDHSPSASGHLPSLPQVSEFGITGRSIALKKPIIIKKNQGYHVYRDSDEEPAESGEICGKQVKVKLCKNKSDALRSTAIEDLKLMTEDEMKHNIKLAKEAVENLQRDLTKIEQTPGSKAAPWEHGKSDAELHQDIEVAREALEHIHKNFDNLESMSQHAVTTKDSKTLQDKKLVLDKTEEERLAQWSKAVEAIQRNVEIARNIEDSFREKPVTGLAFSDDMVNDMKNLNKDDQSMRTTESINCQNENIGCKDIREKTNENMNMKSRTIKDDMASSASTISETKMKPHHDMEQSKHEEPSHTETDTRKEKSAVMDADAANFLQKDKTLSSDSMKTMEENRKWNAIEDKRMRPDNTERLVDMSKINMKSSDSDEDTKLLTKGMIPEKKPHPDLKAAEHLESQDNMKINEDKMQANQHNIEHLQKMISPLVKAAELNPAQWQKDLKHGNLMSDEHLAHHLTQAKMSHPKESQHQTEHMMPSTPHLEKPSQHHLQSFLHPEMKSVDEMKKMQHFTVDPSQTRRDEDNLNFQRFSMKSTNGAHSQNMNHAEEIQMPSHHLHHAVNSHQFNTVHGPHHERHPDFMTQAKSADNMGMQMYYMGPDNQLYRWKSTHEMPLAMRNAYGAPAGPPAASSGPSNGGALAMFPNANLGNLAIPLLLSCNPSVTQGNISKPHAASYPAPAYRSDDDVDVNFHMKRDVKKTEENTLTSLHKTPSNTNLKTGTVLVAKQ